MPLCITAGMTHLALFAFNQSGAGWIVMHLRWPACKHSYVADHVAALMLFWDSVVWLPFIYFIYLASVLRLNAEFDSTYLRTTSVRLDRSTCDPADCVNELIITQLYN